MAALISVVNTSAMSSGIGLVAVVLWQEKHIYSRSSVMVERIDVIVRCNLRPDHSARPDSTQFNSTGS